MDTLRKLLLEYLILVPTNECKEVTKKYVELWNK